MDESIERIEALEELSRQMRRLNRAVRTSTAPIDAIERASAELALTADALERDTHDGPYAQHALVASSPDEEKWRDPVRLFPYSPVIGALNPISPPADFEVDDANVLRGSVCFPPQFTGPPTGVHGGVIAMLLDEMLGSVVTANRVGGFTGTLTVRYRRLTPVDAPLRLEARLDRQEDRKAFASGEIHCGDELTAEAEGVFIRPRAVATEFLDESGRGES